MANFKKLLRRLTNQAPPTASSQYADRASADPTQIEQLAALTEAKDHEAAMELAAKMVKSHRTSKSAMRQVRASASAAGAMSIQREALLASIEQWPEPKIEGAFAQHDGRWKETSSDWEPTIATQVAADLNPVTDPIPGKILHVLKISMPHRQSGYSMRTYYTLIGQQAAGLTPVAVTALDFPANAGVEDAAEDEMVGGVPHHRLLRDSIPSRQPWSDYLDDWATALAPVVAQERPEYIHVHSGNRGYESALVALAVGRALDVPVVYEVRGFFESLWTSNTVWAERAEIYRRRYDTEARCMKTAAAVVTLSESMKADIVERGVDPDKVHVVPNGVDNSLFAPKDRRKDLVEQWGLADNFVFGYVSNLDHYREGQELLIDAAVALRAKGLPVKALIVGDGSRREFLERHAAEVNAGDSVVFTGKVPHDQVLDYYALYDLFVIPRVDERAARLVTPLKPYEAMAVGVPIAVSDLPALQEIAGGGSRGASFVAGDANSLAAVIEELHGDPARRAQLAKQARVWVNEERDWSRNGQRYGAIYDSIG